jgi:hypothetical protein
MHRFEIKKNGATRIVFLAKKYAIKIPRLDSWKVILVGLLANLQERTFSATGWEELCPVIFADPIGLLVIMPRLEPIDWETFCQLNYDLFVNQPNYVVPVENKIDSFGWLNECIVAIDYGS